MQKDAEIKTVLRWAITMAPTFTDPTSTEEGHDLREELAELEALLDRLTPKRYALKRSINRLCSPIIRRLPPDVTSTIFEFCLPDFTVFQLSPFTKDDLSIPLSLGAICSYWRDIAWSTPSLWSSLIILIPNEHSRIVTGIAEEWLARSGQLPLSICISSTSYNDAISALADIINQYSARWSDLDLYVPDDYYHHFHATDNHAPILKSIRFICSKNAKDLKFRLTCPRLERANLVNFSLKKSSIQWDNLTHVTLNTMSINNSLLILRNTPRLVFCHISGSHTPPAPFGAPILGAPVVTSLRSLEMLLITRAAEDFLNNLVAPHLEEFNLPNYYNPSMEVVTSFIRRSACSLRSFSIIVSASPPYFEDLMNLLQSMPSLHKLLITSMTNTDHFEDTIREDYDPRNILQIVAKVLASQSTVTSLQQGFLPNLKILDFNGQLYPLSENYEDLYPLPPADNAAHGPLQILELELYPANRIPENIISYFARLVERGVTVNVLSDSDDILQSSIHFYRFRKYYLDRDWADNFDSSLFS